ncbi:MAG TPA: hypothetical protein VD884_12405 [Ohtaekwangia sp.]|nr:hypothetical protein [Ohtaekwangia sp.]
MLFTISRGLWVVSVLGVLAALLYVYAGLPQQVLIQQLEGGDTILSRDTVFYIALALSAVVNVSVYLIGAVFKKELTFRAWFNGLIITINVFIMVALFTLGTINSIEKFDYSRIAFLVYGSLILVVLWCLTWPLWVLFQKIFR